MFRVVRDRSVLLGAFVYVCVCNKVVFFASYFSCQKTYVKSLTVSNGLVNCTSLVVDKRDELD